MNVIYDTGNDNLAGRDNTYLSGILIQKYELKIKILSNLKMFVFTPLFPFAF